jgi:flavin reductase ActVB
MDSLTFRQSCAKFGTGVAVATVRDTGGLPHGMTVNSFTSVSLQPPLVLICVDRNGNMFDHFGSSTHFGVNVLRSTQLNLASRFSQRDLDRFEGLEWTLGATGVPMLPESLARFECEVRQRVIAGDHIVLIGEVVQSEGGEGEPLIFFDSAYRKLAP